MSRLPIIAAIGGINPAGRASSHHSYRRLVFENLPKAAQDKTLLSLAQLMQIDTKDQPITETTRAYILEHTLIRQIESSLFDVQAVPTQKRAELYPQSEGGIEVTLDLKNMPDVIPENWQIQSQQGQLVHVRITGKLTCRLPQSKIAPVQSGGQLPTGFVPESLYPSRQHPKGLALAIYAASDALGNLGIDWQTIKQKVAPNHIGIYAGSAMGQLDSTGAGGMMRALEEGKRTSAKQVPFGLAEMPADFINAYVIGNAGHTGCNIGACATFLYNLNHAMEDIRCGSRRIVLVANTEAPLIPEIIEGYHAMGALAEDSALKKLDKSTKVNYKRACRPFGYNCGFTLAESGVCIVLMDDDLALELGANVQASLGAVYIAADGFKRSIATPGIGNYSTMAQALSAGRALLGKQGLNRTYVQAHGTGTPQNRTSESHIMSKLAGAFGIQAWPVAAIKAQVGHSLAPAAADQLLASLGVWQDGVIPGITTVDKLADDVHTEHLKYLLKHEEVGPDKMQGVFINSKGFGGNNATALMLSPTQTKDMLMRKHGKKAWEKYLKKLEPVQASSSAYDEATTAGQTAPHYHFGVNVVDGNDLQINDQALHVPGFAKAIDLKIDNPHPDMC